MENNPIVIDTKEYIAVSFILNSFIALENCDELLSKTLKEFNMQEIPISKVYESVKSFNEKFKTIE